MAHTVLLGSASKKLNSTYQPATSGFTSYSVTLKEETSIYTPVLILSASLSTVSGYNYGYFLSRYYWITDIRSIRSGVVEISMTLDYMATYKSSILSTTAFIEYGFNTIANPPMIDDIRIPTSPGAAIYARNASIFGSYIDLIGGTYIVQAVGYNPAAGPNDHTGLMAFGLTWAGMELLIKSISPTIQAEIFNIMGAWPADPMNQIANLMSYSLKNNLLIDSAFGAIQSVSWVPFDLSAYGGVSTRIFLGNYSTGINGVILGSHSPKHVSTTIDIPWPFTDIKDWKNIRSQLQLFIPCFGTIPIPVDQIAGRSSLTVDTYISYVDGSVSVKVSCGSYVCFSGSTSVAVSSGAGRSMVLSSDTISGSIQQIGGAIKVGTGALDLGASVAGAALGLEFGGISKAVNTMISGVSDQIQGYAQTIQPTISSVGSLGGSSAIGMGFTATLILLHYGAYDFGNFEDLYGHPVFKLGTPANGYCKTNGFSVSLPGNSKYAALINATMDGGAFIE